MIKIDYRDARPIYEPVSYTHLYDFGGSNPPPSTKRTDTHSSIGSFLVSGRMAVSYTHLDVYKRQGLSSAAVRH